MAEPARVLPRLYTEADAADYLGIKLDTLQRIRRAKAISFITIAKREYRYREDHLLDYLDGQECQRKKATGSDDSGLSEGQTGRAGSSRGTTPMQNSAGFAQLARETFSKR